MGILNKEDSKSIKIELPSGKPDEKKKELTQEEIEFSALKDFESRVKEAKHAIDNEDEHQKNQAKKAKEALSPILKKWEDEVESIKGSLDLAELLFTNQTTAVVPIIGNVVKATFSTIDYETVVDIADGVFKDTSGSSTIKFDNYHSLMLVAESLVQMEIGNEIKKFSGGRFKKFDELKQYSYNIIQRLVEKYNQFDTAVKRLVSDEPGESLLAKLKK